MSNSKYETLKNQLELNYLRFKIENELKNADYKRLAQFLENNPKARVEILPRVDFEFVSLGPLEVFLDGYGYKITDDALFKQPIGFEVYDSLKLGEEMQAILEVNRRNFRVSKIVTDQAEFEKDLNLVLKVVERIVNHVSIRFGQTIEQRFTVSSEMVDRQFDLVLRRDELVKRDEIPRAFGTIHAGGSKDAKERAGDLVPIYLERDKAYLYEDKKVFLLLPRSFVMKLLKLEGAVMISVDQFSDAEKEALNEFSQRRYVRSRKIQGKTYYFDLDVTTRKLLGKGLMRN